MSATKECRGCLQALSLESFYKHSRMLDGRLNYCRQCVKGRVKRHRQDNLEKVRAYDRTRGAKPERRQQLAQLAERLMQDPVRRKAIRTSSDAIRRGRLVRPGICSVCRETCKPEAHHDDYSKPLEVRWLCRPCHCRHHRLASLGQT